LVSIIVTARVTDRRDVRSARRKAVIESRDVIQSAFEIAPTAPYRSFLPEERGLEIALIDLGFGRYEAYDITRQLYDHRKYKDRYQDEILHLTLRELTHEAVRRADWKRLQDVLARYMSGEISLRRARRKLYWYPGNLRRHRIAIRWAKGQYRTLHRTRARD
jgi:hypothetical protein